MNTRSLTQGLAKGWYRLPVMAVVAALALGAGPLPVGATESGAPLPAGLRAGPRPLPVPFFGEVEMGKGQNHPGGSVVAKKKKKPKPTFSQRLTEEQSVSL